jgi:hypothetical protein
MIAPPAADLVLVDAADLGRQLGHFILHVRNQLG